MPPEEWPADPLYPKVCDPCLRQAAQGTLRRPEAPAEPAPRQDSPADTEPGQAATSDFDGVTSDFN